MKIRIPRPRQFGSSIRDLARKSPEEAEQYLDTHHEAWEQLTEDDPHNAADILEALDEGGAADLLQELGTNNAGEVLDEMHPEAAADVLEELETSEAAALISSMEVDQAADVVGALSPVDRTLLLAALDPAIADEIQALLIHGADTAGGMMTTDVAALPVDMSAGVAIEELRRLHDELGANLLYVYAVDGDHRLVGVVSFRDLVFAKPSAAIGDVIEPSLISVRPDTDREQVADLIHRYRLIAVPVVEADGTLVGMVKFSEAIEAIRAEAGEDIAVMVGAGDEETVFTPVLRSVRRRLPWIMFNLVVGLVIAGVISRFEATLTTYAVLAAYMPAVALLAGNSGAQSLAVIIRSMAIGDLPKGRSWRAIRREVAVGLIDGTIIASIAAVVAALTLGLFEGQTAAAIAPAELALVVFVSMWIAFLVAGFVGSGIPVLLSRIGQDPALGSNIFLTMTTDLVGFGGFLLTATLLLN
ncbi:MAG: magnesium transporter [Actinomycetota bacterium]|nr:magnesium transporter [Actinomycetota bacterium]